MSGSLGFQIEHHLFPDLPSNRYPEIAVKVRALCEKYDLPYTTGPLHRQYGQALRTIMKLSLPNRWTKNNGPDPTEPLAPIDRRRKTDAERQVRRLETGNVHEPGHSMTTPTSRSLRSRLAGDPG
jgi:linoleoyl-CoA desaturase